MPSKCPKRILKESTVLLTIIAALIGAEHGWHRDTCSYGVSPITAGASTGEPTQEEADLNLTSVLSRKADVFASNSAGLFRADLIAKRWQRLPLPERMPIGGTFGNVPENSSIILYRVEKSEADRKSQNNTHRFGIYQSKNDGQTWDLISENDNYKQVLLLPNGTLFATRRPEPRPDHEFFVADYVLMSKDFGKTWKDISGKIGFISPHIFPDPDHHDLVCVSFDGGIREYIAYAEDDRFQWKQIPPWYWTPKRKSTTAEFLRREYGLSHTGLPEIVRIEASLGNYFEYDFGAGTFCGPFDILPEKSRFEFQVGQTISVPVTITFRQDLARRIRLWEQRPAERHSDSKPTPTSFPLVDQKIGLDCWGMKIEHNGKRSRVREGLSGHSENWETLTPQAQSEIKEKLRKHEDWQSVQVSESAPYRRTINLSQLHDFSDLGEYQVQLYYSTWSGSGVFASAGYYEGCFDGAAFTVVVKGQK